MVVAIFLYEYYMSYRITCSLYPSLTNSKSIAPKKRNVGNTLKFLVNLQIKSLTVGDKIDLAKWTKESLLELGPTYIKIGQFVSTRTDIFDKEMIDELKTLQDQAPPFSSEEAKQIISEDLGCAFDDVFSDFQTSPLASASISQVHRARLVSNGKQVVIKVQRPFIKNFFDRDFTTLKSIFNVASLLNSRSISDSQLLLEDCYKYLYEELSFTKEVENIKKFRILLESNTEIIVPEVYEKYSSSRIITMEYVPSDKISSVPGIDRSLLSTILMECFIKQIIDHGIIHADPHPGNIGLTKDGKIVLYDFGQVIKLDDLFVKSVKPLLFSVYEKDVDSVSGLLLKSKAIIPTKDLDKKTMTTFINQIILYFENVDFKEFQLSMIDSDFDKELPFKINSKLIMVFRSLSLLEGICKELDPDFSYFKVIDMIMSDVFFDVDYIDHRARKDLSSLFDSNTSISSDSESLKQTIEKTNIKYMKEIDESMQRYQYIFASMMLLQIWNPSDVSKSIVFVSAFIYIIINNRKSK